MTQHLRELLDGAVVHINPRETDPVPVVLRRVRTHRRRTVIASALAVAVLAAGAVVSWPAVSSLREVPMADPVSGPPPVPRLIDGEIVAAGIRIPVPAGWTVVDKPAGCQRLGPTAC